LIINEDRKGEKVMEKKYERYGYEIRSDNGINTLYNTRKDVEYAVDALDRTGFDISTLKVFRLEMVEEELCLQDFLVLIEKRKEK
jgi:hypothetical protein